MPELRPLCSETLRWASSQLLRIRDLTKGADDYGVAEFALEVNAIYALQWNRLERERRDHNRKCFYFGTLKGPGHYWHRPDGQASWRIRIVTPFDYPDGTCQPANNQVEGEAALRHLGGWTILAWWDRSQDTRGNSCGALAYEAEVGFAGMVELLRRRFPSIYARHALTEWLGPTVAETKEV